MRAARAAVVVLLLLVPVALGSHTVGHRYLVVGRLLDTEGLPLQNATVSIKVVDGSTSIAEILAKTDCRGDFDSLRGVPGTDPAPDGGLGMEPGLQWGSGNRYLAFHFHDWDLSARYKVRFTVGVDTWDEPFDPRLRQTATVRQVSAHSNSSCGASDWSRSLSVRVSVLAPEELQTGDVEPKVRNVVVRFGQAPDAAFASGATDFNGAVFLHLSNVTLAAGQPLTIIADHLRDQTLTMDEEAVKFRRVDSMNRVGDEPPVAPDSVFEGWGIFLLIVGLVGALWLGGRHFQSRRERARLRASSPRKRFHR